MDENTVVCDGKKSREQSESKADDETRRVASAVERDNDAIMNNAIVPHATLRGRARNDVDLI